MLLIYLAGLISGALLLAIILVGWIATAAKKIKENHTTDGQRAIADNRSAAAVGNDYPRHYPHWFSASPLTARDS